MFEIGDLVYLIGRLDVLRGYSHIVHLVLSRRTYPADDNTYYALLSQATGRQITAVEKHIIRAEDHEDYWNRKKTGLQAKEIA